MVYKLHFRAKTSLTVSAITVALFLFLNFFAINAYADGTAIICGRVICRINNAVILKNIRVHMTYLTSEGKTHSFFIDSSDGGYFLYDGVPKGIKIDVIKYELFNVRARNFNVRRATITPKKRDQAFLALDYRSDKRGSNRPYYKGFPDADVILMPTLMATSVSRIQYAEDVKAFMDSILEANNSSFDWNSGYVMNALRGMYRNTNFDSPLILPAIQMLSMNKYSAYYDRIHKRIKHLAAHFANDAIDNVYDYEIKTASKFLDLAKRIQHSAHEIQQANNLLDSAKKYPASQFSETDGPLQIMKKADALSFSKYDERIKIYTGVIERYPKYAEAWYERGDAYQYKKEYDASITDFKKAIQLYPIYKKAYEDLAWSYYSKKSYEEAIAFFTKFLTFEAKPGSGIYRGLGVCYLNTKNYREAASAYKNAIAISPKDRSYQNKYAWILATAPNSKVRDGKKAVEHALRARELYKRDIYWNLDTLAAAYAETGNYAKAIETQLKTVALVKKQNQYRREKSRKEIDIKPYTDRLDLYRKGMPYREE